MKLEYTEKCHITFPSDKGTAHILTELAHIQGITQQQLLQQICQAYIEEKMGDIITKIPSNILEEILKSQG